MNCTTVYVTAVNSDRTRWKLCQTTVHDESGRRHSHYSLFQVTDLDPWTSDRSAIFALLRNTAGQPGTRGVPSFDTEIEAIDCLQRAKVAWIERHY